MFSGSALSAGIGSPGRPLRMVCRPLQGSSVVTWPIGGISVIILPSKPWQPEHSVLKKILPVAALPVALPERVPSREEGEAAADEMDGEML